MSYYHRNFQQFVIFNETKSYLVASAKSNGGLLVSAIDPIKNIIGILGHQESETGPSTSERSTSPLLTDQQLEQAEEQEVINETTPSRPDTPTPNRIASRFFYENEDLIEDLQPYNNTFDNESVEL